MNKNLSPEDKVIARRSWINATLAAVGAITVLSSLAYSGYQIATLNNKLTSIQASIASANNELTLRHEELESIKHELAQLQAQRDASKNALVFVADGINYYHQGAFEKAIFSYSKALQLEPDNQYVLNLLGYSQFKAGKLNEANKTLERALELNQRSPWILLNLAKTKCALGDTSGAKKLANTIISEDDYFVNGMLLDAEFTKLCKPIIESLRRAN